MFNKSVRHRLWILFWQVLVLITILAAWQWLPESHWVRGQIRWMDPFFISSPTRVYHELIDLSEGKNSIPSVWPYLWMTVKSTLIGTAIGLVLGTLLGALLSNFEFMRNVFTVYVTAFNSIPRIALIPIVVLITGPTGTAGVVTAILVVTFLAFFNALEGGRSVPIDTLQNAMLLGASKYQIMLRVRFPYVLMWTFAVVPNAVSFGLLTVVTTELLTGAKGMGGLILVATTNVNASLGFAVAVLLSVVGIILVAAASQLRKILLHWA